MTLFTFFEDIYLRERELRSSSVRQLRMSLQLFVDFLGHDPELDNLSHQMLNDWSCRNPRQWTPKTMRRRVGDVLGVWSYAYAIEETDNEPKRLRVRKPRISKKIPEAWSRDELDAMLAACNHFPEYMINGVQKGVLLKVLILIGFHTALRPADLMSLKRSQCHPDGEPIPMAKCGGDEVLVIVPPYALEYLNANYPDEITDVFAWPLAREYFYEGLWKPMLRQSGLPDNKKNGLQKLRRTAVSHAEAIELGYGARLAGHRPGSKVTYDSYADPRIVDAGKRNQLPKLLGE